MSKSKKATTTALTSAPSIDAIMDGRMDFNEAVKKSVARLRRGEAIEFLFQLIEFLEDVQLRVAYGEMTAWMFILCLLEQTEVEPACVIENHVALTSFLSTIKEIPDRVKESIIGRGWKYNVVCVKAKAGALIEAYREKHGCLPIAPHIKKSDVLVIANTKGTPEEMLERLEQCVGDPDAKVTTKEKRIAVDNARLLAAIEVVTFAFHEYAKGAKATGARLFIGDALIARGDHHNVRIEPTAQISVP